MGCSTGVCSTIQIKDKLFDKILIEQNQGNNYVRLITISTTKPGIVEQNINQTKSGE